MVLSQCRNLEFHDSVVGPPTLPINQKKKKKVGGRLSPNPIDHQSGGRGWGHPPQRGPTAARFLNERSGAPVKVGTSPVARERGSSSHLPHSGSLALRSHSQQEGEGGGEGLVLPSSHSGAFSPSLRQHGVRSQRGERERERKRHASVTPSCLSPHAFGTPQ